MPGGRIARASSASPASLCLLLRSAVLLGALGACGSEPGAVPGAPPREDVDLGRREQALNIEVAPEALAFTLNIAGRDFRVALERAQPPTTADYRAYRLRANGKLQTLPAPSPGCSYRGRVEALDPDDGVELAAQEGFASVSICSDETGYPTGQALTGVLRAAGRFWRLSPDLADTDAGDGVRHSLMPLHRADSLATAPETAVETIVFRAPESPELRQEFRDGTPEETKYVDLLLINDSARMAELGEQAEATGIRFVDTMNALLADSGVQPRLRVTLRGQVFFDGDPYVPTFTGPEVNHESLLDEFLAWAAKADLPEHDEHMLLSGLDFRGGTVGFAGLEVACSAESNGFIVEAGDAGGGFAVLSAVHELGHTLGMQHDDGISCPSTGFIMAAVGCSNCATDNKFSSCSLKDFNAYLAGPAYAGGARCADDVPSASSSAICGDGSVEAGEACDCGAADCGAIDPCCNGATCQLVQGAACSDFNDGCCQDCKVVPAEAKAVCRSARSSCDIEEICTGISKDCPADTFKTAALSCVDAGGNAGACYFGECRSRATQCEQIAQQIADQGGADNLSGPGPRCEASCDEVVCGSGPNSCTTITGGPRVPDGVLCAGGQCVNQVCVALVDQCPNDTGKSEPGVCGCGNSDKDSDGDATADCLDECPMDPNKRARGTCGCGASDKDSDGDGTADCKDKCPMDAEKQALGACGCGVSEQDSDNDGTPDCLDECPADASTMVAGICGCGVPVLDVDLDGTPDCNDACPEDAKRTTAPCGAPNTRGAADTSAHGSAGGGCAMGTSHSSPSVGWLGLLALPLLRRRREREREQGV
jgi:reprolysin (M12B) family zinc metalloprotease/disintegrin/thrombospondin type 3 repeat protein